MPASPIAITEQPGRGGAPPDEDARGAPQIWGRPTPPSGARGAPARARGRRRAAKAGSPRVSGWYALGDFGLAPPGPPVSHHPVAAAAAAR